METLKELVRVAEKKLGAYRLVQEENEEIAIRKFALIGQVLKMDQTQVMRNMQELCKLRFLVDKSLLNTPKYYSYSICGEFAESKDPYILIREFAKYGILAFVLLISGLPSRRILVDAEIKQAMRKAILAVGQTSQYIAKEASALDPLRMYLEGSSPVMERKVRLAKNLVQDDEEKFERATERIWARLEEYGARKKGAQEGEEVERDRRFFSEITTWMGGESEKAVMMFELMMAGVYKWPLFHRILAGYAEDMSDEEIDEIIHTEFAMYEYLQPFLQNMQFYCKYGNKHCDTLYDKFASCTPSELAEIRYEQVDLSERATKFLIEQTSPHVPTVAQSAYELDMEDVSPTGSSPLLEDPDFPSALTPEKKLVEALEYQSMIKWVRLPEVLRGLYGKEAVLFGQINSSQFSQGMVGDCWLMSGLSSAAEFPDFVRELFDTQTIQNSGKYTVLIAEGGKMNKVQVNDLVPCVWAEQLGVYYPIFMRPNDESMWPALYEKAAAKYRGGYGYLEGGHGEDAYKLFGSEAFTRLLKLDEYWVDLEHNKVNVEEELDSFMTLEYMVTASIDIELAWNVAHTGLIAGHAYNVLKVARLTFGADAHQTPPVVLMKLRNPWGREEWTGDWSDFSDFWWKYDAAEKLQHEPKDDGVFWMPMSEFLQYYDGIEVNCSILTTTCSRTSKKRIVTQINIKRHE
jgi:hypothetical protein